MATFNVGCRYPLKYGPGSIAIATVGVGLHFFRKFSDQLLVHTSYLSRVASNGLVAIGSCAAAYGIHTLYMLPLIRYQSNPCEACTLLSSGALGATAGTFVPSFAALVVATSSAHLRESYNLPSLDEGKLKFLRQSLRNFVSHWYAQWRLMLAVAIAQFFFFQLVTFLELQSAKKLNRRLVEVMQDTTRSRKPINSTTFTPVTRLKDEAEAAS